MVLVVSGAIRQLGQGVAQVEFEDGRKDWVPGNALARIKPFVPAESQPQGDQAQQQQPGSQPQQPPSSQLQTKVVCSFCSRLFLPLRIGAYVLRVHGVV